MKKILTVSLFAVMAVSAAHADIASTNYVGTQIATFKTNNIDPINTTIGTWGDAQKAVGTDVATAVVNLSGKMNGTGDGSVSGQIDAAINDLVNNGQVKTNTEAIATLNGDENTAGSVANAIKQSKDYADTAAGNALTAAKTDAEKYIDADELSASQTAQDTTLKTYADGKASAAQTAAEATAKAYADAALLLKEDVANKVADDTTYSQLSEDKQAIAYPTYGAMVSYVGNVQNNLSSDVAANANAITDITKVDGTIDTKVKALADGAVKTNTEAIAALNNAETGALAQAKADTDAKIDALDATVAVEANSNKFVTGVVEENGVLTSVQSSTINAAVVALADVPEACAAGGQKKCALSVQDGKFSWEIIEP